MMRRRRIFGALPPAPFVPPVDVDDLGDAVFPVVADRPKWRASGWGEARGSDRRHAAIDIGGGELVVSPVAGRVLGIQGYYKTKAGVQTDAMLVFDGRRTFLLGEIAPSSPGEFGVDVGDEVEAGQPVARVGATGHLHFGVYEGPVKVMRKQGEAWYVNQPPPPHLRDVRPFLEIAEVRTPAAYASPWSPAPPGTIPAGAPADHDHDHDHDHDQEPPPAADDFLEEWSKGFDPPPPPEPDVGPDGIPWSTPDTFTPAPDDWYPGEPYDPAAGPMTPSPPIPPRREERGAAGGWSPLALLAAGLVGWQIWRALR